MEQGCSTGLGDAGPASPKPAGLEKQQGWRNSRAGLALLGTSSAAEAGQEHRCWLEPIQALGGVPQAVTG